MTRQQRRTGLWRCLAGVAALGLLGAAAPAAAQDYPSRPIQILCGQPAGSGPDTMTRLYADAIGRSVGQRVVVENRVGAAGIAAASALMQAAPDGYTLMLVLGAAHTIAPALQKMPFDPLRDFDFITLLYSSSGIMLVPATSPAKTFAEFVALMKAKPGGATFGTPGIGSPAHLMGSLLSQEAGIPMTHVPYRGGGQILVDLIADRMDFTFISSVQAKPFIVEGKVRALATSGSRRMDFMPDVPTLAELGYGDAAVESWFGIAAPKGTPAPVVAKIHAEFMKASDDPLIRTRAVEDGATIRTGSTEEFVKVLNGDFDRLGKAVRALGIKAE